MYFKTVVTVTNTIVIPYVGKNLADKFNQGYDYDVLFDVHLFLSYRRPTGGRPPSKELQLGLATVPQQNTSTLPQQWTNSYIPT